MPEIWLLYGKVEVVVEIKAENLAGVMEPSFPKLDEGTLFEKLKKAGAEDKDVVVLSDVTDATLKVASSLTDLKMKESHDHLTIMAKENRVKVVKKAIEGKLATIQPIGEATEDAGEVDGLQVRVPTSLGDEERRVLISEVGFDPLFGFTGGPVSLLRTLNRELLAEAFKRSPSANPGPGANTSAADFASRVAEQVGSFLSIEVLPCQGEMSEVFLGDTKKAHSQACGRLNELGRKVISHPARAVLTSPGNPWSSSTLASSLRFLWNIVGGVSKEGMVVVLAEGSEGLGSEALQLYVTGRLRLEEYLKRGLYVEGLEDLVYLRAALQRCTITLVSTLPKHYVEKLGLMPADKASDALDFLLKTLGPRTKVHVVTSASDTLLTSREG